LKNRRNSAFCNPVSGVNRPMFRKGHDNPMAGPERDHGGGVDGAAAQYGGPREAWIDLSTGINPVPYPLPDIPRSAWADLPDREAHQRLVHAARKFWNVPEAAAVLPVPGASASIAHIPRLTPAAKVRICEPTYNEHAAAFVDGGWHVTQSDAAAASVVVHPNNPDGRLWHPDDLCGDLRIIDESFCDVMPDASLMAQSSQPGSLILKSFGKFWGLAGLRLGFVIGDRNLTARIAAMLGPWPVAGPALHIGAVALADKAWADETRTRLFADAARLDALLTTQGATIVGGTSLFRLYEVSQATDMQEQLAQHRIWSRVFPYNPRWLRLGLPPASGWERLEAALR